MRDPVLASRAFGAYLGLCGLGFLVAPGPILARLGLPVPADGWIRMVGLLTVILAMYFTYCAQPEARRFFRATVVARLMFFVGVGSLAALGLVPPLLVVFGLVDLAGAAWTLYALHATEPR